LPRDINSVAGRHRAGVYLHLRTLGATDFSVIRDIVIDAEKIGIDGVLIAGGIGALEPLTLLAALAPLTRSIALIADIAPLETHPYTAARRLAAVDHVSAGRIGWSLGPDIEAGRQADYVAAVRALWDSWDDDVHRFDKATGVYIDTAGIRAANYVGPFYRVAGPLDIPRPPQGLLPRFGVDAAADVRIDERNDQLRAGDALVGELIPVTLNPDLWRQARAALVQRVAGVAVNAVAAQTLRQRLGLAPLPAHSNNRKTEGETT
jgi:hypothetical protein